MFHSSINISGRLLDLSCPFVMQIVNVTSDSFYDKSRCQSEKDLLKKVEESIAGGAKIIDIGACSTRPDASLVSMSEEWARLDWALGLIRREFGKDLIISVDTFRGDVACRAIEKYGVQIINDVYGGRDKSMFPTIARYGVVYVLTHSRGTAKTMQSQTEYNDLIADIIIELERSIDELERLGVSDILVDPGFGFAKTTEQNYELLNRLDELLVLNRPLLVGISRKSMLYKPLKLTPEKSLVPTVVANTIALLRGASILRVHDALEAKQAIEVVLNLTKRAN